MIARILALGLLLSSPSASAEQAWPFADMLASNPVRCSTVPSRKDPSIPALECRLLELPSCDDGLELVTRHNGQLACAWVVRDIAR